MVATDRTFDSDSGQLEMAGPKILQEEFEQLRELVRQVSGVTLGDAKRAMLAARLSRRLRHLGLSSYGEYYRFVKKEGPLSKEVQELVNCITTNKTDFFRESHHFDFLRDQVFPQWHDRARRGGPRSLRIWSAGCSSGEEPYTLAVCLLAHFGSLVGWDVKIVATDIDTDILARAQKGVYDEERIDPIPIELRKRFFLRGTGQMEGMVSVRPELRSLIEFRQLNFIDDRWPISERFDAIFCRNVMIYFDRETQHRLVTRFGSLLNPDGYLFLGHSENIHNMGDVFVPLGKTIHRLVSRSDSGAVKPPSSRVGILAGLSNDPTGSSGRGSFASGSAVGSSKFLRESETKAPKPVERPPAIPERNLIVGDVVACDKPTLLKTLLGSCVSACIFDPQGGIGGMNHFSLPGESGDEGVCTRYGVHAMELLINEIMKRGGDRRRLKAKVFGGAKVLKTHSEALNIGRRNGEFVLGFLQAEGIEVVSRCLGGDSGLRIHFSSHTGKAMVKPLESTQLMDIARDEDRYTQDVLRKLVRSPEESVTLF